MGYVNPGWGSLCVIFCIPAECQRSHNIDIMLQCWSVSVLLISEAAVAPFC